MKKNTFQPFHLLLFTFLILLSLCSNTGCSKQTTVPVSVSDYLLNTVVTISIYETDSGSVSDTETILDDCLQKCKEYENLFDRTAEGSDICRINHAAPAYVSVSEDTRKLLSLALEYCRRSDGQIDITIAPVKDLWGFSDLDHAQIPESETLSERLTHVDYRKIEMDGDKVRLTDPEAAIDLGFIAKGYIADRLKEFLIKEGVTSAIINLGGNVLTIGSKQGQPFKIGIQKPFSDTGTPITTVLCTDSSVVTSGIYERYFVQDNVQYHHILDPSTGYPADTDLLSATILSGDSTTGDALSTTCLLLGLDKAKNLIASIDGVEAVFITKDYEIIRTDDP